MTRVLKCLTCASARNHSLSSRATYGASFVAGADVRGNASWRSRRASSSECAGHRRDEPTCELLQACFPAAAEQIASGWGTHPTNRS